MQAGAEKAPCYEKPGAGPGPRKDSHVLHQHPEKPWLAALGGRRCTHTASLVHSLLQHGQHWSITSTHCHLPPVGLEGKMHEGNTPCPETCPQVSPALLPSRQRPSATLNCTMGSGLLTGTSPHAQQPPYLSLFAFLPSQTALWPPVDLHDGATGLSPGSCRAPFPTLLRKVLS